MDELYVLARRVLLNALEALEPHREATVLVGAQAVYLHTGEADLAVAPFTTDADIAIDPALLAEIPPLEEALERAGFTRSPNVGIWTTQVLRGALPTNVEVDLLVPTGVSPGTGRHAARLVGHAPKAARKVAGLEGALVDCAWMSIESLEPSTDARCIAARVAGPGALLIAKLYKISERVGTDRSKDKDALDILRLLRTVETEPFARSVRTLLSDERSEAVTQRGLELLHELFGTRASDGPLMAARAVGLLDDQDQIKHAGEILANDLLDALRSS